MSASEKLRALDGDLRIFDGGGHWVDLDGPQAGTAVFLLKGALPLIADVVEAAERIENMMWDDDDDPLDAEEFALRMAAVGAGLTALREHLERQ